jgi:Rps23 Pro-64 3,4-dihydroxylase Tpa1-like proline 4-hydroxylase
MINSIDREELRRRVQDASPFPFFCIDGFLEHGAAERILAAYPTFEDASKAGTSFSAVNERGKVQVTDSSKFSEPIAELNQSLADPDFLGLLSYVFDLPELLADDQLVGGGIHQTGPRGHLDVHVDFNYIADRQLHRRLNILIYFNKDWDPSWGGNIELWDRQVTTCTYSFSPVFNRCVVFETSDISYHGVSAVKCPEGRSRKSFAAYYYTREAPPHWDGEAHSTIFKARPHELVKGRVLMPLERMNRGLRDAFRRAKNSLKPGPKH